MGKADVNLGVVQAQANPIHSYSGEVVGAWRGTKCLGQAGQEVVLIRSEDLCHAWNRGGVY